MIELCGLSLDLDKFRLHHVDLAIKDGEYVVLLGPTGSGKTVLLECIVGLNRRHKGKILIDGVDVTHYFPEERNVGYVPQDYALFPNMTVEQNLAYGLRIRKATRSVITEKVTSMLAQLGISGLARRFPVKLSGGEKQRVALGRALLTDPCVLLLDEPLSALDGTTRRDLTARLRETQRSVRGTFLHVCHHLEEALEVADRIVIIRNGGVVQVGTPEEILYRPSCLFVAQFTQTRNLLPGRAEIVATGSLVELDGGSVVRAAVPMAGRVLAAVRPELIELVDDRAGSPRDGDLRGRVVRCAAKLSHLEVEVNVGALLTMYIGHREVTTPPAVGKDIRLRIAPEAVRLFPPPPASGLPQIEDPLTSTENREGPGSAAVAASCPASDEEARDPRTRSLTG